MGGEFHSFVCGVTAAVSLRELGLVAVFMGIFAGWLVYAFLGIVFNLVVVACEEKKADFFAAAHSTDVEIQAAADFFEKRQQIIDMQMEPDTFLRNIPQIFISGHPHGAVRARYLRTFLHAY